MSISHKSNLKLWQKVKNEVIASSKGGKSGSGRLEKHRSQPSSIKKEAKDTLDKRIKTILCKKWTDQDW